MSQNTFSNDVELGASEFSGAAAPSVASETSPPPVDKVTNIVAEDVASDAGTEETEKEVHYRRGKNKVEQGKTLEEQLQVPISNSRMRNIMNKFQAEEDAELKKKTIIAFKAATDPSYLIQSSVEEIWLAVKRREAWAQIPFKMVGISCCQIALCLIAMLAANAPVNPSTGVMAIIYTLVMAANNPFDMTTDLAGIVEKHFRNFGHDHTFGLAYFVLVLFSPILAIPFALTIIFDFFAGKMQDCSYGSLVNIVVDAIVKATAISVGMRSGNPINAIQTFVGFEFISEMDELLIESVEVDMLALTSLGNCSPNWNQSKKGKMLRVRLATYFIIPSVVIVFGYITIANTCYIFCQFD